MPYEDLDGLDDRSTRWIVQLADRPFKLGSPLGLWGLIGVGIVVSLIFPGWVVWGVFFESAASSEAVWATWGPLVGAHLLTGTIVALGFQLRTITQRAKEWRDAWEREAE